ncbi:S-layer homology domain-containing protein [Cohnella sp. REN36]|uniref:S-layer homology domain-containing protein n=1 Tax=Cohnella sp. REN36 TaxID=2887347 RepID=UPI001D15C354|nr:S-layer homology domain-containing protein [Cohnella sp. REN36]MCC3372388.1 S-layer homology domain-containing protein [Cohnella sp. REN36]
MRKKVLSLLVALTIAGAVPVYAEVDNVNASSVVRTTFQTGAGGDDESAHVLADSVMVYVFEPTSIKSRIASWTNRGYQVDVMMALNRDMNYYKRGLYDGVQHVDEIQKDKDGNLFTHSTSVDVPYMVPTENWNNYIYSMAKASIDAGARRIVFEEPDMFIKSGYSDAFKREWLAYYGEDWVDPASSKEAEFKSQKLKVYLCYRALKDISERIKAYDSNVKVLVASHSGIGYLMYGITTSNYDYYNIPTIDGYIAQEWSDAALVPVPANGNSERRIFESAYIDYSSFAHLKLGDDGKQLYALADPKADTPGYSWTEYEQFYKTTIAAQLMQPQFKQFEVVPWSERGFAQAPGSYKTIQTNVYRALQDMYEKSATIEAGTQGIGILYSDTISQMSTAGAVPSYYGPMVPLVAKGIPLQVIPAETLTKPNALANTKVLFVSYDVWKAIEGNVGVGNGTGSKVNDALRDWVKGGGVLVYTGGSGSSDQLEEWWTETNLSSPKQDLWNKLALNVASERTSKGTNDIVLQSSGGAGVFGGRSSINIPKRFTVTSAELGAGATSLYEANGQSVAYEQEVDQGKVIVMGVSADYFASSPEASQLIRDIAKYAVEQAGETYTEANLLKSIRGPYTTIQVMDQPEQLHLQGSYIDLFDDRLQVVTGMTEMQPRTNAMLYDINDRDTIKPEVLFASGELTDVREGADETSYKLAGTPNSRASARLGAPEGLYPETVTATDATNEPVIVSAEWENSSRTLLIRHDHQKQGVTVHVQWSSTPVPDTAPVNFVEKRVETNQNDGDADFKVRYTGGQHPDFRFTDHSAELVYKFNINQYPKASLTLEIANNYVISVSGDDAVWTELFRADLDANGDPVVGGANKGIRRIGNLAQYANANGEVYVKMTNADPTRGNGPVMYSFTLHYEERIAPFTVRTNDTLDIQPGETKTLELAVTNRDTVAHQVAMSVLPNVKDTLSFIPESAAEGDYLVENRGSAMSGGGRYADGANYFVYKVPVPQDMGNPELKLTLSNRFEVSLSSDGTNWTVVDYEADSSVEGGTNKRERSYPISNYQKESGWVYVKIGDHFGRGWGGMLHRLSLSGDSEPELAIAFPDNQLEILPHQTRTIHVQVTPNTDITSSSPQQSIRLSTGDFGIEYLLPIKIKFVKPVYLGHWASSPITIDGVANESEWNDATDIVISQSDPNLLRYGTLWGNTENMNAKYRLKWDDTNLYVLEQRGDSEFLFTETGGNMFSSTASMLFLDIDHNKKGAAYRSGDYAVMFTAGGPDSQPHVFLRQGDDGGAQEYTLTEAVIKSVIDTEAHKYVLEMAIPWSALQITPFSPSNDRIIGMSMLSTRKLSGNVWGQLMWMGNGDDQANWADMKLVGKLTPEPPVDVTPPVITLIGSERVHVANGATYTDAGVTITDNRDTGLTAVVTYTKDGIAVAGIDTTVAGTYICHYNVKDSAGNAATEVIRTVIVAEANQTPTTSTPTPISQTEPIDAEKQQVVSDDQLKNAKAGMITIEVLKNKESVILPTHVADLIGSNRLRIVQNNMTIEFSKEQLQKIQGVVTGAQAVGAQINFSAAIAPKEAVIHLEQRFIENGSVKLTAASDVIDFKLNVVTKDGSVIPVTTFTEPLTLTFRVNPNANPNLLGIYSVAADGTIKYVGGKLNDAVITVKVNYLGQYAVLEYDKTFSDVSSSFWASEIIKHMVAKHIIEGVSDTRFAPQGMITRAEFAAMIARALELKAVNNSKFKDVGSTKWFAESVAAVEEAGIVLGRSTDLFAPNDSITREEMAVISIRAYEYQKGNKGATTKKDTFSDQAQISVWAQDAVSKAQELGFINGRGKNRFAPKEMLTRAEGAQVLSTWLAE